jgi:flagellar biosynthesis protein FlhG
VSRWQAAKGGAARPARRLVALAGGRGGTGRSVLAANIAVYLAQLGKRVVLVDADLGGACQHTILGIDRPQSSLTQVIDRQADHVADLIVETPVPNLHLLPGASDRFGVANLRPTQKERLLQQIRTIDADFVLLDVGAGTSFNVLDLFLVADSGLLVTVPEPMSVEALYRFVKSAVIRLVRREVGRQTQWPQVLDDTVARLGGLPGPLELREALYGTSPLLADLVEAARIRLRPWLVVNRTKVRDDDDLGPAIRTLAAHRLGVALEHLGSIEHDDAMWVAARKRRPLMIEAPGSEAGRGIERICRRILAESNAERASVPRSPPRSVSTLSHYELLDLDVGASEDELRRAFKRIRDVYRRDGLAGYSILPAEVARSMRDRIQLAHDTLLDPNVRHAYDLAVSAVEPTRPAPALPADTEIDLDVELDLDVLVEAPAPPALAFDLGPDTEYTGELLRRIRAARGVELREITARTKIGTAYLEAIEAEDFDNLPALVYTKGFVSEMAKYLELDHAHVVKSYVARLKKHLDGGGKGE